MTHEQKVKEQLKAIGADFKFWGVSELRELPKVLFEDEQLNHVINGRYSGGFATLCATDQRVLLIDKKPLYLTLEDIRYDMISDVMYNHRLLNATVLLGTVHKSIAFIGYNPGKLRNMTNFIQQKVLEFRQRQNQQQTQLTNPESLVSSVQNLVETPQSSYPINPYKMPVMIRRRVSRFY